MRLTWLSDEETARFQAVDTWQEGISSMSGTCENMDSKTSPWMGASSWGLFCVATIVIVIVWVKEKAVCLF